MAGQCTLGLLQAIQLKLCQGSSFRQEWSWEQALGWQSLGCWPPQALGSFPTLGWTPLLCWQRMGLGCCQHQVLQQCRGSAHMRSGNSPQLALQPES